MKVWIQVKSAKLFFKNGKNDDIVCNDMGVTRKESNNSRRTNFVDKSDIIKFEPISNMLHVLMGERPVPTYRAIHADYSRLPELDEIAKNCLMRFDTAISGKEFTNKKGELVKGYITEFISGKKSRFGSCVNLSNDGEYFGSVIGYDDAGNELRCDGIMDWHQIRSKYIYANDKRKKEKYIKFIEKMNEISGENDVLKTYPNFLDFVLMVRKDENKKKEFLDYVKDFDDHVPYENFMNCIPGSIGGFLSYSPVHGNLVNANPKKAMTFDCTFVFDMPKELADRIKYGTQCARYLDGGIALYVSSIQKDISEDVLVEEYNFKHLNEINNETKNNI